MFCGVPASGKSTIAQILNERLPEVNMIVSDDISKHTYYNIMRKVDERIGEYKYIIVDGTFYKEKWRKELREVVGDRDDIKLVYVQCSLETCLQRNQERGDSIPEKAIHIIWNDFDEPEDPDISINTEKNTSQETVEIILREIEK
jgi:tRNA uridine 5-carbamoylmethylation protein Kti12